MADTQARAGIGAGQAGGQEGAPEQGQQGIAGAALWLPAWKGRKRSRKARLASRRRRMGLVYSPQA